MTPHGTVQAAFKFMAALGALLSSACEPDGGPGWAQGEPGVIIAPTEEQESQLGNFTLSGTIRIGTGE